MAVGLKELLAKEGGRDWASPDTPPLPWLPPRQQTKSPPELLALLGQHYDTVKGNQVDLAALQREVAQLQPFDHLVALWPEYDADKNHHWSKAERARLAKDFPALLDLDGNSQVSNEELQEVGWRFALQRSIDGKNPKTTEWLAPEARRSCDALYLPTYDANHNGRWEPEELKTAVDWEIQMQPLFFKHPEFDLDGDKKMSLLERMAFVAWLVKNRDAGSHGVLARKRMDACILEEGILGSIPEPEKRTAQRAKLLAAYDLNDNGQFEVGEAWLAWNNFTKIKDMAALRELVRTEGDRNHDGVLEVWEAEVFLRHEEKWSIFANPYFQVADLDRDNCLCPQERAILTRAWLKDYDLDGDGRLEASELQEKIDEDSYVDFVGLRLSVLCGTNGFMVRDYSKPGYFSQQLLGCEFATRLCDLDGDGWLDAEELDFFSDAGRYLLRQKRSPREQQILDKIINAPPEEAKKTPEEIAKILGQPPSAEQRQQARADADAIQAFVARVLNAGQVYDADRDGKLSLREMQTGVMLEPALREFRFVNGGNEAAARELDRNGNGKIEADEWPPYLASLLPDYDANHNGRIDPKEMQEMVDFERLLLDNLKRFEIPPNADGQMDAAGRKKVLEQLARRYDLNGDGQMDLEELRQKNWSDWLMSDLCYLYPGLEPKDGNDLLTEKKRIALEAILVQDYDTDHDGKLEAPELKTLFDKLQLQVQAAKQAFQARQAQERQKAEKEQARRQQEAEWLKKYDLDGNGQLDPEERKRAEKETNAGLVSPAREE